MNISQRRNEMVRHGLLVSSHVTQMSREIVEGRLSFQVLHLKRAILDDECADQSGINRGASRCKCFGEVASEEAGMRINKMIVNEGQQLDQETMSSSATSVWESAA